MKKRNNSRNIIVLTVIAFFVTVIIVGGIFVTRNIGKTDDQIQEEDALSQLQKQIEKIDPVEEEYGVGNVANYPVTSEITADDLPDIETIPLSVTGTGDINLEIFSSPEKAGENTGEKKDSWLIDIAEKYNNENFTVNGKSTSVSVRNVDSGMAMQYISSGKSVPELYSPSNEAWGEMLESKGIDVEFQCNMVGNVAGILLKQNAYNLVKENYGGVDLQSIVDAVINGDIVMGYTNPMKSSSGLNLIIAILHTFDSENPFSDEAVNKFEEFQKQIPYIAYTTMQLRDKMADGDDLDACIIEYQSWANMSDLQDCKFLPYGIRHDEPLYSIGNLSSDEKEALDSFIKYCQSDESQALATKYGFNGESDYVCELPEITGNEYIEAQKLFKEKQNPGQSVAAVFVADVSGSMDNNQKLVRLKESLLSSFGSISSENSIGIVSYANKVYINLPIAKFDMTQKAKFVGTVESLSTRGETATYSAVLVAADMLVKYKEQNPNVKLKLFVLSDGEKNCGVSYSKMAEILSGLGIQIYSIGYDVENDELENMAMLNEGDFIDANTDDVVYKIKQLFNSEM